MITQAINLNLIPGQVLPRVNVSQYDSGTRTLQMALFNGEQIFNVPSGASGFIQGTKPDRTGFQYAATVTAGSNIVTIDITQQMTAVKGEVVCELVLANDDDRIATVNFILYVEAAALADDTVISETDLPLIEEAAELAERIDGIVQQVDEDAQTASNAADKAEAYGTHPPYIGANGNWFVYNVTTQQYEDSGVKAQGPLSGLTDVALSTLTDAQSLIYDATSQKWVNGSVAYSSLSGKPTLGTAAAKDVPASGNASSAEVVLGSDTRLTDARTPVSHTHTKSEITDFPTLGTAAGKDFTTSISSGSGDLITSGAVYSANETLMNQVATKADSSTVTALANDVDDISDEIADMNNVLGAKNLLPNNAVSQTLAGVTFTVNSDGTVTVSTESGGATSSAQFILFEDVANWHNMILSGAPSTASATTYDLAAFDTQTSGENSARPNEVALTNITDGHTIRVFIRVRSGQIITTPITFKPMIRPASVADDTYVPYAMTNRELTEEVTSITSEQNYHKGARQKLFRMTTNTKLVAKVRKTAVVSWGQMVLRFVGTNNGKYYDSIAYAQFNSDGTAVSGSRIVNLADADPTLTVSFDSDYLIITIGNLTNYIILALDYYDNGMYNAPNHEDWIFSQEA